MGYYITHMKELIYYNKDLLTIAQKKLDVLSNADYNKNHPGPYFEAVNRQVDYINILKERIDYLSEREKSNNN
tara:strand:- start:449 stop:667 length:219 start_codon:yes stop_codon:yes gene_type:complete